MCGFSDPIGQYRKNFFIIFFMKLLYSIPLNGCKAVLAVFLYRYNNNSSIKSFNSSRFMMLCCVYFQLSITEYRQRKKLNNNDKSVDDGVNDEQEQENNLSQSPKPSRQRSNSTSSATSFASSDDDMHVPEMTEKGKRSFQYLFIFLLKNFSVSCPKMLDMYNINVFYKILHNCYVLPAKKPGRNKANSLD